MTTKEQITTMLDTMTELELLKLYKHMIEMQIDNMQQSKKLNPAKGVATFPFNKW